MSERNCNISWCIYFHYYCFQQFCTFIFNNLLFWFLNSLLISSIVLIRISSSTTVISSRWRICGIWITTSIRRRWITWVRCTRIRLRRITWIRLGWTWWIRRRISWIRRWRRTWISICCRSTLWICLCFLLYLNIEGIGGWQWIEIIILDFNCYWITASLLFGRRYCIWRKTSTHKCLS